MAVWRRIPLMKSRKSSCITVGRRNTWFSCMAFTPWTLTNTTHKLMIV